MAVPSILTAGFIGFYALYTRAFTSFTDLPISYRTVLCGSCLVTLLVLALLNRPIRAHAQRLVWPTCLVLAAAFALQTYLFLVPDSLPIPTVVATSSLLMGAGYALYWTLWVFALQRFSSSLAYRGIAIGTTVGVGAGSVAILAPASTHGGAALYCAVWATLLAGSCLLLRRALSGKVPAPSPHTDADLPQGKPTALRRIALPTFVYAVAWFTLYSGHYHQEANGALGIWVVLVSSSTICLLLVSLSLRENDSRIYLDLLGDVLLFLGLSLYLLFAATNGLDEPFWIGVLFSNCLVDIIVMGKMASLDPQGNARLAAAPCLVLATREAASLVGMQAYEYLPPNFTAVSNTLLVTVSLLVAAVFIALKTYAALKEAIASSSRLAHTFAERKRIDCKLTDRESQVLEELLDGATYRRISQLLFISESTVKTHANHIYSKLDVSSRDELIELYKAHRAAVEAHQGT